MVLRANFVKMYDNSNTLVQERHLAYERIFANYGKKQNLALRATKEVEHDQIFIAYHKSVMDLS
ncbi:MAG: hypothetical protein ACJ70T_02070, partial [Nitrososphaera sp.]